MRLNFITKIKEFVRQLSSTWKRAQKGRDSAQKRLQKNFVNKQEKINSEFISRKNQSMQDSQGANDFSGSSYNGPGNVDREKRNSNMNQRNF